jgi:CxxC motif-containing protein
MSKLGARLVCLECPRGCELEVERGSGASVSVSGQACARGEDYGRREMLAPSRTLTGTVRTLSPAMPRLPVRSALPILRDRLIAASRALDGILAEPPLEPGDVVAHDFAGLGTDLIATDELPLAHHREEQVRKPMQGRHHER